MATFSGWEETQPAVDYSHLVFFKSAMQHEIVKPVSENLFLFSTLYFRPSKTESMIWLSLATISHPYQHIDSKQVGSVVVVVVI